MPNLLHEATAAWTYARTSLWFLLNKIPYRFCPLSASAAAIAAADLAVASYEGILARRRPHNRLGIRSHLTLNFKFNHKSNKELEIRQNFD